MTAPAPRNHPTEGAHPAPTPALDAVLAEAEERARNQSGTCTGEHCEGCESGRRIARARAELAALTPRPEPVVAPLPSEAIHAAAASLAEDEDVPKDWDHVVRARNALERALPHLRLVSEDEKDTLRERIADAIASEIASLLPAADDSAKAYCNGLSAARRIARGTR